MTQSTTRTYHPIPTAIPTNKTGSLWNLLEDNGMNNAANGAAIGF
jgi:hypothetical protein